MAFGASVLALARKLASRVRLRTLLLGGVGVLALLWIAPMVIAAVGTIDLSTLQRPYLIIGLCVVFDAVIPIFPSESLLTAASTLIAGGNTDMRLAPLMLTGAVGAIIGDSVLFLLARTAGRSLLASNLERAKQNERAAAALRVLGSNVGTLIVCGRFVPGLRFVVNATMGMSELPFRRFLFWVTVGGTFWSVYTCGVTYLVGQALGDYPLVSFATSAIASTILLGLVAIPLKRQYERERDAERLTG